VYTSRVFGFCPVIFLITHSALRTPVAYYCAVNSLLSPLSPLSAPRSTSNSNDEEDSLFCLGKIGKKRYNRKKIRFLPHFPHNSQYTHLLLRILRSYCEEMEFVCICIPKVLILHINIIIHLQCTFIVYSYVIASCIIFAC
jgi:hypothetical protein